MRKILSICSLLALVVSLFACTSNGSDTDALETMVCTYKDETIDETRTFEYEGDEVVVYTNETIVPFELLMITEDEANTQLNTIAQLYEGIAGLTYEGKIEDDNIVEKTTINLREANMEELVNENIIPSSQDGTIPNYISLQQLQSQAESEGLTCE